MPRSLLTFLSIVVVSTSLSQAQVRFSKSSYPVPGERIERADFTSDGFEDILVYDKLQVQILPNSGNGAFDKDRGFAVRGGLFDAALVDFNRDGNIDVAGCQEGVIVYEGNGQGSLTQGLTIPGNCGWIVSGDFNGDGNPDLAIGTSVPRNQVIVYFGDGRGGLSGQVVNDNVNFTSNGVTCGMGRSAVASDFTGNKKLDIVIQANCDNESTNTAGSALIVGTGDGTGHFSFHKEQDYKFSGGSKLRIADGNQDNRSDIYFVGGTSNPQQSALLLLVSNGDGTFMAPKPILTGTPFTSSGGSVIEAYTMVDLDGDGLIDGVAVMRALDAQGNASYFLQDAKQQFDGKYIQFDISALANGAFAMTWGDFDKDGRADLAIARGTGNLIPSTTDVWLNTTASNPTCPARTSDRSLALCGYNLGNGTYHFVGTPLDKLPINAMQIYVDGVVNYLTPDDLLDANLSFNPGSHRVTAKAWDDLGAFSSVINLTVQSSCSNSTNRTVHICLPKSGASFTNSGGKASVEIVAAAASNLNYSATQVYVDGSVVFSTASKAVDVKENLSIGSHRITVKGWDSSGAFSTLVMVTVK
jgi:hypothetical protein